MASKSPKYELLYRQGRDVCAPLPQIVDFFATFEQRNGRVLDLGCGQGRDALFIARKGHAVVGVDISATGIAQMLDEAAKEDRQVEGVIADIVGFEPGGASASRVSNAAC
jgi:tellurite methyltransferase